SGIATLVKQAVDIVDVIGRAVHLRRSGNRHVGLCPFHQEKTPSFQVDAENQLYYCFGCASGGDVLNFVMKHQNLTFADAVKYLSDRYNIPLPQRDHAAQDHLLLASQEERRRILAALECATEFFCRQLNLSREGRAAREYIARRELPAEVVESQKLGYAPPRWDGLLEHLKKNGIEPALALKAGLLSHGSNDSSKFFDRFRNRLIFPIRDERGAIVAFGGRILSQDEQNEPKYLNSPETPVYHKGRMLYQYSVARDACRQVRQVVLVEGYMDLLAFHAKEFYRVAATLGTALTSQQVRLLSRMCDEVVLAYDGDDAGERAMLRALPLFLQEELSVSCVRFPDGLDPDDFLKKFGLAELERLIAHRDELGAYAVRKAVSVWDGSSAGRAHILSEIQPMFQTVRQPLLKSEYLRIIADRFSIAEEVAEAQLFHEKRGRPDSGRRQFRPVDCPKPPQIECLEEKVLRLMIKYPELAECVRESEALGCFEESRLSAMAGVLCRAGFCSSEDYNSSSVYDLLRESDLQELYARYLLEPYELEEPEIQLRHWLEALIKRRAKKRKKELQQSLQEAERKGDLAQIRNLLVEIKKLTAKTNVGDFSDNV
ncbi:MAG: DNA primase, partial [Syntrophobacteraceae bacterium]